MGAGSKLIAAAAFAAATLPMQAATPGLGYDQDNPATITLKNGKEKQTDFPIESAGDAAQLVAKDAAKRGRPIFSSDNFVTQAFAHQGPTGGSRQIGFCSLTQASYANLLTSKASSERRVECYMLNKAGNYDSATALIPN